MPPLPPATSDARALFSAIEFPQNQRRVLSAEPEESSGRIRRRTIPHRRPHGSVRIPADLFQNGLEAQNPPPEQQACPTSTAPRPLSDARDGLGGADGNAFPAIREYAPYSGSFNFVVQVRTGSCAFMCDISFCFSCESSKAIRIALTARRPACPGRSSCTRRESSRSRRLPQERSSLERPPFPAVPLRRRPRPREHGSATRRVESLQRPCRVRCPPSALRGVESTYSQRVYHRIESSQTATSNLPERTALNPCPIA